MKTSINNNDRREARAWMVIQKIRQTDIKKALGHKSMNQVHGTLQGYRSDRRVLQYLIDLGCPTDKLCLPVDMLKAA